MRKLASFILLSFAMLLPASAGAQIFEWKDSFISGAGDGGRFAQAIGLTSDNAGRVYVADFLAGRVEIYDNAESGNKYLRSLTVKIGRPTGVWVDNRQRVYVADAQDDSVAFFDNFNDDFDFRREFGGAGTEIGKMSGPRGVTTDRGNGIFVVERENARIQYFRPQGGKTVGFAAFGTGGTGDFLQPEGVVREGDDRFYVTNDDPFEGRVRVFDKRGKVIRDLAGPGGEFGQVSSPRGIVRDPAGRILVVDAGNSRVQIFSSFASGNVFLGAIGLPGAAEGRFSSPNGVTVTPGANLYVADTGNGRVVRIKYDDADDDGAIDARDNCRGLANVGQTDTDKDGKGDPCDEDIDNDGKPNEQDKCPREKPKRDANNDGCFDLPARRSSR
ncbi:MAG: thrombospondin type 3 repeat-containing protein [Thermoleophilaceae bacterium]|nr:thrombospondin type 3 repeat-containing protein [Thermoleophilaceae bacterium]